MENIKAMAYRFKSLKKLDENQKNIYKILQDDKKKGSLMSGNMLGMRNILSTKHRQTVYVIF